MTTLNLATARRPAGAASRVPHYDPTSVRIGHIHLGIGAFHRAHQAVYTDDLLALRSALGHLRRQPARAAVDRRAQCPGRAVHGAAEEQRGRQGPRDRRAARGAVPRHRSRAADGALRGPGGQGGDDDGDREGLLPRPRDGQAQSRASGHRPRPRAARAGGLGARRARRRARRAARRGRRSASPSSAATTFRTTGTWSRAWSARSRSPSTRRSPTGSAATSASPARWSTGSFRRRHPPTSPRRRACSASTTRCRWRPSRSGSG